jgi:NitT/TauT family transport system ATP-binding protein
MSIELAGQINRVRAAASSPSSGAARPMIELCDLQKVYQLGQDAFVALERVSLTVIEGEFFSLVGPSGCGKSTILNIIAGLAPKSGGEARLASHPIKGPSREIGMMFQSPVLLPWRTNLDNLLLPVEVFGLDRKVYRERALSLLDLVGLAGFAQRYPFELSGGMQQRVAICRMLLCDPVVLLMDEPFSALDEMTREFLNMELLRIWQERRKTVVFVTHNIGEAVLLSDRVAVMAANPGRLEQVVAIDLPRPRGKATLVDPAYFRHVARIRSILG